jgi:3-hydroxyacyl-[acyl-carrier-protein] dehydratase
MLQLHAIVFLDFEAMLIAGYKDVRSDEFWVSGHMPGYPLFPGVMMCEAAAQMISFYTKKLSLFGDNLLGLGGLDGARFRYPVRPGDRLLMIGKGIKVSRRITVFDVQGYVGSNLCFEVRVSGVPIPGQENINKVLEAPKS